MELKLNKMNKALFRDRAKKLMITGVLAGVIAGVAITSGISSITVSYTHLTLPTKRIVEISVGPVYLKKKKKQERRRNRRLARTLKKNGRRRMNEKRKQQSNE